jgi:hypothetical protein
VPDPDLETDGRPESDPGPRDRPVLLAATPDADAVFDWLRTLAALAGLLCLLLSLIALELLVRI